MINSEEPKPLLMISNSEIEGFKQCRRKWNLSSFNRRNLIPKVPNLKFWIGTGGHYALERWHGYGEDPIAVFKQWAITQIHQITQEAGGLASTDFHNDLSDMVDLGVKILTHYKAHAEKRLLPKYEFFATEYEFSVPIPGIEIELVRAKGHTHQWVIDEWGLEYWNHDQFKKLYVDRGLYDEDRHTIPALYVGRLDGLVRDKAGSVWVIDHKFMASLVDPEMLTLDAQTAKYVWAANVAIENGWWPEVPQGTVVRGALYNVVRKKAPSTPAATQKGTSQAKNIDTTEEHYKATLIARGEDYKQYTDMLLYLRGKNSWVPQGAGGSNKFFQLLPVERGERELELIGEKITYEYLDMNAIAIMSKDVMHPALYPSSTMDCRWKCSFKHICYVANYGGDVESLIEQSMVHQKRSDLYATQVEQLEE